VGAFAHNGLGSLELARGDVAAASQQFHESEHLAKTSGNLSAEVQSLTLTASIALHQGSIDKAGDLLRATVPLIEQQPFYEGNAYCLETAARYALAHERPSIAAEALGLATALRDLTGASTWAMLQRQSEAVLESVRDAMGEQAFTAAFNKGRSADPRASARMVMHAISPAQGSGEAGAEAR
jgi:ATP/maltotriose-dependent transcriptional regulator MalT